MTYTGPEQPQGVDRFVTGWENNLDFIPFPTKGPRRGVCLSGIWNHCNVAEGSSWTKNFRLNILSSENHFRSASCLCCSLQQSSANVCPSSEDMEPPPSPVFQEALKKQEFCLILNKLNPVGGNNKHNKLVSCNNSRFAACSSRHREKLFLMFLHLNNISDTENHHWPFLLALKIWYFLNYCYYFNVTVGSALWDGQISIIISPYVGGKKMHWPPFVIGEKLRILNFTVSSSWNLPEIVRRNELNTTLHPSPGAMAAVADILFVCSLLTSLGPCCFNRSLFQCSPCQRCLFVFE